MADASAPTSEDPRFAAALDLLRRSGASEVQIRYDEEQDPVVWVAYAKWPHGEDAAGGMHPLVAVLRLMRNVMDSGAGARCAHCGRPADVADDWQNPQPLDELVCWFVFDPETAKYRRSCEGDTVDRAYGLDREAGQVVGRNDPCPCGSGEKWKRCHGRG